MAIGRPAPPPPVLGAMAVAFLCTIGAWVMTASACARWNALALGPICGEPRSVLSLVGHCAACPLAVALTAIFGVTLLGTWRKTAGSTAVAS